MKNNESVIPFSKNLSHWIGCLKVGHKIGLGYGLAIFVAIVGTTTGFVIGDSYHKEALEREENSLNAYRLVNDLQNKALLIRLDWLELPIVLDKPELVKIQKAAIKEHQADFYQLWTKFKSEFNKTKEEKEEKEESIISENDSARQLFKTYSQFPDLYLQQVEELIKNLNFDNIQPAKLETTRTKLANFSNTERSRKLESFAKDLLSLSEEMYEEYEKAEAEFGAAQQLRLKIFFASAVLSVVIAILLAILTNLSNAIDALDENNQGRSFTDIQNTPNQIKISTSISEDMDWVLIKIQDNGAGISSENVEQIFDNLFTTKPIGKGTGLGLSISYQIIVEKHCGKLWCESAPREGATFAIQLPI